MDANILTETGEYFINLYTEENDIGAVHSNRTDAIVAAGNYPHKRLRLNVVKFGDVLDIFDVD